ncbi:class I mannose-6-phosphate isomerase [Paenibacillus sp. ACRRX]|uniref:class I mannose-6-phosphate isomerase n=1 Tax=Paenibacillus sp. ACRRX TaxID=2918206 RepID=UPI001EF52E26|nr:class I mannose-6-phosphate isomerase [Paenibacillus sp. ACRRX]MCG7408078.1 class I mannose-6-phosphate isomerase [Paenibacillus sp. ACRRX]
MRLAEMEAFTVPAAYQGQLPTRPFQTYPFNIVHLSQYNSACQQGENETNATFHSGHNSKCITVGYQEWAESVVQSFNTESVIQATTAYNHHSTTTQSESNDNRSSRCRLIMDGTHGADFDAALNALYEVSTHRGISVVTFCTYDYMKSSSQLKRQFKRYLTDNRAFGYMAADVSVHDYFRDTARNEWQSDVDAKLQTHNTCALDSAKCTGLAAPEHQADNADPNTLLVIYGPGALWLQAESCTATAASLTCYLDLSRENQQLLHKQGMGSLGIDGSVDSVTTYKEALFLEWPVWERYRKEHLAAFHTYVDMNDCTAPVAVPTPMLMAMLHEAARQPFRVKPFFASGIWGGQYLKELCSLPKEWPNCAWSFEPIAPENTLLLRYGDYTIEVPFTIMLQAEALAVLGPRNVELFGDYFPIRFNYLDTIDGDRLSLQVHPKQPYVESEFNETMTQQESYYMMEQKPDSTPKVILGLQDGVTGQQLLKAVDEAHATQVPLGLEDYVNEWAATKGDLFLIPPGAVHSSGRDNLVLEISSTTWWFTFKIYDYLRLDKDGLPRPINREHAACNIDDSINTTMARQELIAKPVVHRTQGANVEELLAERDDLLFQVRRLKLADTWNDDTEDAFVMLNLVEGERVRLIPEADASKTVEWGYAEAYIVPASVGRYRLENAGEAPCTLIRAQVAPSWRTPLLPHGWHHGHEVRE